jgi:hypothetical protein
VILRTIRKIPGAMLLVAALTLCPSMFAQTNTITIRLAAGETKTVWTGVNVSGKVFVGITTRDGSNKAQLWWIKQPFGRVEQLGEKQEHFSLDIPSLSRFAISSQLRVKASSDTVIHLGENVEIAYKKTFEW